MTSHSGKNFKQHSEAIAGEFLQTVMVVDDRAYFRIKESPANHTKLVIPGLSPREPSGGGTGAEIETSETNGDLLPGNPELDANQELDEPDSDKAHELNAKKLIETFATKGIVCAVIRPKDVEVETLEETVLPLAENSDIVVFDWVLGNDKSGEKVKEMIRQITRRSSEEEKRLRLIVVYTGQLYLASITRQIKKDLKDGAGLKVKNANPFTLISGPVRIAVYAKPHVRAAPNRELAARVVPIEQIPEKLINEFATMTMGLVSNVAVRSLAALRSNTHHILSKFHAGIDAPFLAHRAMLSHPGDAGTLLAYLIGAELTAILDGEEVGKTADEIKGDDIIRAWLRMKEEAGYGFVERFNTGLPDKIIGDLNYFLRKGVTDPQLREQLKTFKSNPHRKELTAKFSGTKVSAKDLEHQFAILTSMKSDYRVRPPALGPGTVLEQVRYVNKRRTKCYWVCIQPICDSVRLNKKRSFPLLQLKAVEDGGKFDLVLPRQGKRYIRVNTIYSPYKSVLEDFDPSDDGLQMVRAEKKGSQYYFRTSNGRRYRWVAELKFEHAQRIVNQYAATFSRVGLDESEWLRRSAS